MLIMNPMSLMDAFEKGFQLDGGNLEESPEKILAGKALLKREVTHGFGCRRKRLQGFRFNDVSFLFLDSPIGCQYPLWLNSGDLKRAGRVGPLCRFLCSSLHALRIACIPSEMQK